MILFLPDQSLEDYFDFLFLSILENHFLQLYILRSKISYVNDFVDEKYKTNDKRFFVPWIILHNAFIIVDIKMFVFQRPIFVHTK